MMHPLLHLQVTLMRCGYYTRSSIKCDPRYGIVTHLLRCLLGYSNHSSGVSCTTSSAFEGLHDKPCKKYEPSWRRVEQPSSRAGKGEDVTHARHGRRLKCLRENHWGHVSQQPCRANIDKDPTPTLFAVYCSQFEERRERRDHAYTIHKLTNECYIGATCNHLLVVLLLTQVQNQNSIALGRDESLCFRQVFEEPHPSSGTEVCFCPDMPPRALARRHGRPRVTRRPALD